jgi:hypothetical protein
LNSIIRTKPDYAGAFFIGFLSEVILHDWQ